MNTPTLEIREGTSRVVQWIETLKGKMPFQRGLTLRKVNQLLEEFNQGIPAIKALGLSLQSFHISMGLPPKIEAVLVGSAEAIDGDKIQKLIEVHQENTLLVGILRSLRTASHLKGLLGEMGLKGIEATVTIGLPPRIGIRYLGQEPARLQANAITEERRDLSTAMTAA